MSRVRVACIALVVAGLLACGTTPPTAFYALSAQGGAAQPAPWHTLRLRRPTIAGYLDRPQIVRTVAGSRVGILDTDRWASPLDDMLGRVLAQDVEQRLPGTTVLTEDAAITADADATVEVDVRQLGAEGDDTVSLVAEVAVESGKTRPASGVRTVSLRATPAARTTDAVVHTMSVLLGELADQIAALARAQNAAAPAASAVRP